MILFDSMENRYNTKTMKMKRKHADNGMRYIDDKNDDIEYTDDDDGNIGDDVAQTYRQRNI